jgi:hypothetical protein
VKPKTKRLSYSMRAALDNLAHGRCIDAHVYGRSQHGGFAATCAVLRRCGLIRRDCYEITEAGLAALESGRYDAEVNVYVKNP